MSPSDAVSLEKNNMVLGEEEETTVATTATTATDINSSSQQPTLVDGLTEAPELVSVEGSHEALLPANQEDINAEIMISEGAAISVPSAEAEKADDGAEWEIDSSPMESSSSDTSSGSSSSDDSDDSGDGGYTMLDPAEQARILMEGDGGSDDEGGRMGDKDGGGGQLRTKNEKPDVIVEKPDVTVTPEMKIEDLGAVENLVENLVLVKAKISGEYRVLETGSVLCVEDRSVIGVVAETLGRVQQPYYSVRFTNAAAITEAGIVKGTKIFYVEPHSTYVFTQPLKAFKGSDASNLHDEEVGEDEIEFSDDEAEAEYKRRVKQRRQARKDARFGTNGGSVSGERNIGHRTDRPREYMSMSYNDSSGIKYDDNDGDELYTPLPRPPNLHEMMSRGEHPIEGRNFRGSADRGWRGSRGGGDRGRGRGDRGRGARGGRGERGDRRDRGRDQRPLLGNGSQFRNEDRRPVHQEQQQYGHGPSSMSPMAPPPFSPQQPQFSPQANQFPPQPPFQPMYPQQPYPSPHQAAQAGFSMPPQNYYPQHQPYPQQPQYSQQQPMPASPNGTLPPGAFVNPAFFHNQQQQAPMQNQWPIPPQHQYPMQTQWTPAPQTSPPLRTYGPGQASVSAESDAAFRAAQEKLDILRHLGGGSGSP